MKRFFLYILSMCLITILLVSCGTAKHEEAYEAGFQAGQEEAVSQESLSQTTNIADKSRYTEEEICATIWNKLPYELPDEYKIEQFDFESRTAEYLGNNKWKFEVYGSGEDRITVPKITEEKSDVLWIERAQEIVTTYDLRLQADFFERGGILEIAQIEKLNKQSSSIVSETTIQATLLIMWDKVERDGWRHQYEGQVRNISPISLSDVYLKIEWYEIGSKEIVLTHEIPVYTREIYGEQYAGLIPPEGTAHFKVAFNDKRILGFGGDIEFFTPSGEIIPHLWDFEFLKKEAGL
ncbi:hypothetical protein ACFLXJ_04770 [Chloroflexota bacterium]